MNKILNTGVLICTLSIAGCASNAVVTTSSAPSGCLMLGNIYAKSLVNEEDAIEKLKIQAQERNGNLIYIPIEQHENVLIMVHENAGKTRYERAGVAYKCPKP